MERVLSHLSGVAVVREQVRGNHIPDCFPSDFSHLMRDGSFSTCSRTGRDTRGSTQSLPRDATRLAHGPTSTPSLHTASRRARTCSPGERAPLSCEPFATTE